VPAAAFTVLDGDGALRMADDLADVYAEAFANRRGAVPGRSRRRGAAGVSDDPPLEGRPHRRGVLSARRDDDGGQRLYDARGWQEIGRDLAFVPGGDPYVILARRLPGHPG
jgi:hypothetical protein